MAYTITDIEIPEFTWDFVNNKATGKRVVRIEPWDEVWNAAFDLSGASFQAGQIFVINPPAKFPGQPQLWLRNVRAKGFTDCFSSSDSYGMPIADEGAELVLDYGTPDFDEYNEEDDIQPPTDTFLTIQRTQSIEFVSENVQGLFWPDEGQVGHKKLNIDSQITSSIGLEDLRITWHRVTNPPWNTFKAYRGTVNDATFAGYDEEQVMFIGVQDQRQFQVDGDVLWNLTMQFSAKVPKFNNGSGTIIEGGWNHFPRPEKERGATDPYWQKVYRSSDTQTDADLLFLKKDFGDLFKAP